MRTLIPLIKKISLISCSVLLIIFFASKALALDLPEKPVGFVNDYAGILKSETKSSLETKLSNFEKETAHEIAVVVISDLQETYIEDYAEKLFQKWGIGKEKNDNGALLLVAIDDRKLRIEVGYGLEGVLTDSIAGRIINNIITPEFKKGDYDTGIVNGVDVMMKIARGEVVDFPKGGESSFSDWWVVVFWLVIVLFSILGQSKRWWPGGVWMGGGAIVYVLIIGMAILGAVFFVLGMALFGLLLDYVFSKMPKNKGKGGNNFWYWGGGGSGGGSGGFGGFGGGSSGGGGASGGW